jgi:hypothetical protein
VALLYVIGTIDSEIAASRTLGLHGLRGDRHGLRQPMAPPTTDVAGWTSICASSIDDDSDSDVD